MRTAETLRVGLLACGLALVAAPHAAAESGGRVLGRGSAVAFVGASFARRGGGAPLSIFSLPRIAIALLPLVGACTLEWNGGDSSLPLIGEAPALSSLTKLSGVPVGRASAMTGVDGAPWTAFCELWSKGSGNNAANCKRMHLVRLGAPTDAPADEVIAGDSFGRRSRARDRRGERRVGLRHLPRPRARIARSRMSASCLRVEMVD